METPEPNWIAKSVAMTSGWLRRHSNKLSALLMVGIFGLLVWQLVYNWHSLPPGFFSNVSYPLLLASLAVLTPVLLFVSLRWGLTLRAINVPIGWWTSVRIWFLSQAGRYLPGGVWSYVGRFYLGRSEMSQEIVVASMVLETGLRVVSEVLVFLISLPFWADSGFIGEETVLLLISGVGLGLLLVHPTLLERLSGMPLLQRVGLEPVDLSRLRYCKVLALLAYYVLTVFLVGGAFHLLVAAFYPLPVRLFPALTGSLAASVVLGFLVPLTPNGWGVREGLLAFLLSQMMPFSVAIVVSVAARIWLSLGEATWIVAMVYLHKALEHK
jgi:uncharacterized membrane protein YbhN (UPF0104 family)